MTKTAVLEWIARDRLVPVVRAASEESALQIVDALLARSISILEVTMTVPGAVDVIRRIVAQYGDRVLVGAGTVLDSETARECVGAGAKFIVSPGFDAGTVAACVEMAVVVAPGALTPTEILAAWRAGADIVKVFPCDALGGPSYIKALKAPLPQIPLMPTGGVTLENLNEFFQAGAVAVGVGGNLVNPSLSRHELVARARAFAAEVKRGLS